MTSKSAALTPYAGKLIDVLRFVNFNDTPDKVGMAVVSQTNRYLK